MALTEEKIAHFAESESVRLAQEAEARRDACSERRVEISASVAKNNARSASRAALASERQARWSRRAAIIAAMAAITAIHEKIVEIILFLLGLG